MDWPTLEIEAVNALEAFTSYHANNLRSASLQDPLEREMEREALSAYYKRLSQGGGSQRFRDARKEGIAVILDRLRISYNKRLQLVNLRHQDEGIKLEAAEQVLQKLGYAYNDEEQQWQLEKNA